MIHCNTLASRSLLDIARQRNGLDEARCRVLFEFLGTAAVLHAALQRSLSEFRLTDLKLGVLVVLFVTDPAPATPADLAAHTGVTRSAMTDSLDQLEARALVRRQRDTQDRRLIHVQLTEAGRLFTNDALTRYLQQAGRLLHDVEPLIQNQLLGLCSRLHQAVQSPQSV